MNLSVRDVTILSAGELRELTRLMAPIDSPVFTAMTIGEDVTPVEAFACLDVECGLAAQGDDTVHSLLNRGLERLLRAFPELETRSTSLVGVEAELNRRQLGIAREKIEQAKRRGGATERRLTDAMSALLSTDEPAARSVVNLLLGDCDPLRLTEVLRAKQLGAPVRVFGERDYAARSSRLSRRTRERRFDLLFVAGPRAVAVEVKLGASLADRQLDDLLRIDVDQLGRSHEDLELEPSTRLGVIVLGPRELDLGGIKDPRGRLLTRGAVRWSAVLDAMAAVRFQDPATNLMWEDLFGLYLRRRCFGPTSIARPTPHMALEALAIPLCDHVQNLVGKSHLVRLDTDKGLRVTAGRTRSANIELVIERRRPPRRERRITIRLMVPKGGRRTATIVWSDDPADDHRFAAPAALGPLREVLTSKLDGILNARS